MTTDKLLKIAALLVLVLAMAMVGCEGDEGPAGPAGPAGPTGPAGDDGADGENALNTCSECHNDDSQLMAIQMQFQAGAHYETVYWPRTGSCTACHNHNGFITSVVNGEEIPDSYDNTVPINCRTCHQIHNEFDGDDYALTTDSAVELTTGGTHDHGNGNLCANCHQSRPISPAPVIGGDPVTIGSFRYGPHYAPQGNILSGNAMYEFEGSASYDVTTPHQTSCTACHMITPVAEYGMDSYVAGGHVFALSYDDEGEDVEAMGACTQCHSSAESFDAFGGQTATMNQLDELAALLVAEGILAEGNYAVTGEFDADVAAAFLNFKFIYHDGSYGVHNPHYVRALLTNTIEAMEARVDVQ